MPASSQTFRKADKTFLGLFGVFLLAGLVLLVSKDKAWLSLQLNLWMNENSARFFILITSLAEGVFITLITGSLLFRSYGETLIMLINLLLIMLIVAFLKQQVFPDHLRPGSELLPVVPLKLADGVEILHLHSFPSGHTASAFGMFYLLSVFFRSTAFSILFFSLALLVGISRVFLVQHYFEDIYFGSLTGMGVSFLLLQAEKRWLQRGIPEWYHLSIIKRKG